MLTVTLVAGGLGGAGVAATGLRSAARLRSRWCSRMRRSAPAGGRQPVVDLFGLLVQVAPVRLIDGAPIPARMMTAGVVTVIAVLLVQTQGARL